MNTKPGGMRLGGICCPPSSKAGACLLAALVALSLVAAQAAPPPNVLLSRGRTEPTVAVAPARSSLIVGSANTNYSAPINGTYPVAYFTSHDGGRSFTAGTVPVRWPFTTGADTSVAISRNGTVFYSYLGETPSFCGGGGGAVLLSRSTNAGRSFGLPVIVDSNPNDDRPTMTIEDTGRAPHVFASWDRYYTHYSEVWYARSLDGGRSFSRPTMLYSSKNDDFGAIPVVDRHGHVTVFWLNYPEVASSVAGPARELLRASRDDGAHFGAVRGATGTFATLPVMSQPGALRVFTVPAVAVAPSGTLYIAWAAVSRRNRDGSVNADIWLSRSTNQGASWSKPRRVNDVRQGDRFMPTLSVLNDGSLGIAFYDRRFHPWQLGVYAARASFDHGFRVTRNVRVNGGSSPVADIYYLPVGATCFPGGRFFGDYIGSSVDGDGLAVVWADTQLHRYDETDIWFARVPLPVLR